MQFNTTAIHSHQDPEKEFGAVITPIYQTSTFAQPEPGEFNGYDYTRSGNPTISVLEGVLADLEGGHQGFAFASGMGAFSTLCMALLNTGDHMVVCDDVYGGTYRMLDKVFKRFGLLVDFVDMSDPKNVEAAIRPETKLVYLETPTNPLLKLIDIQAIIAIAKNKGLLTCVDNTFATPYLQNPFKLGADFILHSTTKYIGGHSDVVGGAIITNDPTHSEIIGFHQNSIGANSDPFGSWLTLRGLKTLGVRMDRHSSNAMTLAQWLEQHDAIESVVYPGLPSHPQHELAKKQMNTDRGFGGMITMKVKGGEAEARTFLKAVNVFTLAESLGGIESLIEHPAIMTHASVEKEIRESIGITDNLIRLSVGIENVEDLQADLEQALKAMTAIPATV